MRSTHEKKQNRRAPRILAAVLTIAIAVPVCMLTHSTHPYTAPYLDGSIKTWTSEIQNPKNPESIYTYVRHADLSPAGVGFSGYDESRLNTIISELEKYSKKEGSFLPAEQAIPLLLDSLIEESDHLSTQSALADKAYYLDVNNDEMSAESARTTKRLTEATDRWNLAVRHVLEGPYGKILREKMGKKKAKLFEKYEPMTKKEKKLLAEETDLVQEYDQIYSANEDLTEYRDKLTSIYLKLVKNRNEQAKLAGYDNYAEYAYPMGYHRDYSTTDADKFSHDVKKYVVPLFCEAYDNYMSSDYANPYRYYIKGRDYPKFIAPYIADIDPELKPALNYMRRYNLADIDDSQSRYSAGYTADLYEYATPMIFYTSNNDPFTDLSAVVHEFGHFNNAFHNRKHVLYGEVDCYDVSEIHSQGLEMLFTEYYDDIYGEDADSVKSYLMLNWLSTIIDGCLYDEFQREVYSQPDMTAKDLNKLCADLYDEYGFTDAAFFTEEEIPYMWLYVPHNFDAPMYYISYATSMFGAMEIWADSLDNREAAIKKYMEVTAIKPNSSYVETVKKCGLENPFKSGTVEDVTKRLKKVLSN